ncbi:glycosyltransferase family 2 protein [Candidatus Giovannonibacteria bacterium]|nr:glycosyltransferase family 2 protein [Candidatus Giovannonibacteria bacterium]
MKLISIGLPAYNRASIIRRTLDSLLSQTYGNFELIISDDASTDGTEQICREYAERDKRIRYTKQESNLGVKGNFYFVLGEAHGQYFMRASDDDWWAPDFLEKLITPLENNSEYICSMSSFARVYNNGEVEENLIFDSGLNDAGRYEIFKRILMRKKGFDHLDFGIIKTDVFRKITSRQPPDKGWDAIICAELALAGKIYFNSEILRFNNNKLESPREKISKISPKPAKKLNKFKLPIVSTTYANLFLNALWRGLTSRVVPWRRKMFLIFPWLGALYSKRKKFFGFYCK